MSAREAAYRWSVVAVGGLLLSMSLGYLLVEDDPIATDGLEMALPTLCALGTIGFGVLLRRHWPDGRDVAFVALAHVVGGVFFAIVSAWLLFVTSLEARPPAEPLYILLNGAAIGTLGTGLLGASYLYLNHQRQVLREQRETLRATNDQLRRQNDRLSEFADVVAHDLRNPLNVAMGRLQLSAESGGVEHLEAVAAALDRAEAILTDMLTLARRGQTVDETEPVDLDAVAEAAWESVSTDTVRLEVESTGRFEADESRLRQLFENLYRNAIDHGGESLTALRVGRIDGAGFYVEDDGQGIPEEDRERVFDSGFSSASDGTGFGLAIVSAIVDAHHWDVAVANGRDGGARIEVTGIEIEPHQPIAA